MGDWVEGDEPMTEHASLFPMCSFVQGHEVGNIPLSEEQVPETPSSPGHDETGLRWSSSHTEPNSTPEKGD